MQMPTYEYYSNLFKGRDLPLAYLDLDMLDANIKSIAQRAGNVPVRIASKSVRCTWVLRHILKSNPIFQGLMCFTGREALELSKEGFDDLLLGYPLVNEAQIRAICQATKAGKRIIMMVDCVEHFKLINRIAAQEGVQQPVCIDVDMSSDFPGVHFGVYRSPVVSVQAFKRLVDQLPQFEHVKVLGLMGYEAQIAGLGERNPHNGVKNVAIRWMKKKSIKELSERREACVKYLLSKGHEVSLVNGGGTGSIESTKQEPHVTEITVGSGFYSPVLFDYYEGFKHLPAAGFALEVVRKPKGGMFTALGGGYVASGSAGPDKLPQPYLPEGIQLTANEGTGEVQTPFVNTGTVNLEIGDVILFRHSKAGELCERFNDLHIISKGAIKEVVPTYRGQGYCFL
jgi:D-serine deaminase-like pyridoxal phosphate-dependent protein